MLFVEVIKMLHKVNSGGVQHGSDEPGASPLLQGYASGTQNLAAHHRLHHLQSWLVGCDTYTDALLLHCHSL